MATKATAQEAPPPPSKPFPQVSFEGLFYLNYETGQEGGVITAASTYTGPTSRPG